jgi:hypothetical protein
LSVIAILQQQSLEDTANSVAFIDLPGFTHVRFGTHDRSDHFALEVDDEHGHAFIANFPALVSMILGTSWVILVEMLCP